MVLLTAATAYLAAVVAAHRRGRRWPPWRAVCWCAGLLVVAGAPAAHHDFTAHMTGHLLTGMVAPLLLVLGAPVTLALRALPVRAARRLSHLLAAWPVRIVTHPVTAAVLDAGGLVILYTTGLYAAMAGHPWLAAGVHAHVLIAGYLFTAAMIGVDPAPHRPGRPVRAAVLIGFLAAHAVLAKHLYGHPPIPGGQAGAQLMYYGGDVAHLVLIVLFCHQWYVAADPHRRRTTPVPGAGRGGPWRLPDEIRIRRPEMG